MLQDGRVYVVGATARGVYFIRVAICALATTEKTLQDTYDVIKELTTEVLREIKEGY